MNTKKIFFVLLFLFILGFIAIHEIYGDKTVEELRKDISSINTDSSYSEPGQIQRTCLSWLYGKDTYSSNPNVNKFTYEVKSFLEKFMALDKKRIDDANAREEILKNAPDLKSIISQMEETYNYNLRSDEDKQSIIKIIKLSKSVLINMLNDTGSFFEEKADNEKITIKKIELLENALECYSMTTSIGGNIPEELNKKISETKNNFYNDIEKARNSVKDGDRYYNEALDNRQLATVEKANEKYHIAISIYEKHNIQMLSNSEKYKDYYSEYTDASYKMNKANELKNELQTSFYMFVGICAIILIITFSIIFKGLLAYKRDEERVKITKIFK